MNRSKRFLLPLPTTYSIVKAKRACNQSALETVVFTYRTKPKAMTRKSPTRTSFILNRVCLVNAVMLLLCSIHFASNRRLGAFMFNQPIETPFYTPRKIKSGRRIDYAKIYMGELALFLFFIFVINFSYIFPSTVYWGGGLCFATLSCRTLRVYIETRYSRKKEK